MTIRTNAVNLTKSFDLAFTQIVPALVGHLRPEAEVALLLAYSFVAQGIEQMTTPPSPAGEARRVLFVQLAAEALVETAVRLGAMADGEVRDRLTAACAAMSTGPQPSRPS